AVVHERPAGVQLGGGAAGDEGAAVEVDDHRPRRAVRRRRPDVDAEAVLALLPTLRQQLVGALRAGRTVLVGDEGVYPGSLGDRRTPAVLASRRLGVGDAEERMDRGLCALESGELEPADRPGRDV